MTCRYCPRPPLPDDDVCRAHELTAARERIHDQQAVAEAVRYGARLLGASRHEEVAA